MKNGSASNIEVEDKNLAPIKENMDYYLNKVSDVSEKAVDISKDAVEKSVDFAKKYPVHTAIGTGVVGFFAGMIAKKLLK